MEDPTHSNKKVILVAVGAVGVVLLFLFLAYLKVESDGKSNISTDSQQPEPEISSPVDSDRNPTPTEASMHDNNLKTYQNAQYSINYPTDWIIEELSFPDGDTGVSVVPNTSSSVNPSLLIVESKPISSSSVKQKQQFYIDSGLTSSNYIIDNTQATRLRGTIDNAIQLNNIYFSKGDSDYLLKYMYLGKGVDQSLEAIFIQMISSFKFN